MHRLLNFICLPLFIIGIISLSNGLLGYNSFHFKLEANTKTSGQINELYSEKEITLILKGLGLAKIPSVKKSTMLIIKAKIWPNTILLNIFIICII